MTAEEQDREDALRDLDACDETNDTGKPRYTNEAAREAATTILLATNGPAMGRRMELAAAEREKALAAARLEAFRESLKLRRAELLARVETL